MSRYRLFERGGPGGLDGRGVGADDELDSLAIEPRFK